MFQLSAFTAILVHSVEFSLINEHAPSEVNSVHDHTSGFHGALFCGSFPSAQRWDQHWPVYRVCDDTRNGCGFWASSLLQSYGSSKTTSLPGIWVFFVHTNVTLTVACASGSSAQCLLLVVRFLSFAALQCAHVLERCTWKNMSCKFCVWKEDLPLHIPLRISQFDLDFLLGSLLCSRRCVSLNSRVVCWSRSFSQWPGKIPDTWNCAWFSSGVALFLGSQSGECRNVRANGERN